MQRKFPFLGKLLPCFPLQVERLHFTYRGDVKMTEENREYRTSQIMLRNQFHGKDKFKIPIIPKGNFGDKDF